MKKPIRYIVGILLGTTLLAGAAFAATSDTTIPCLRSGNGYHSQHQLSAEQQKEMQPIYDRMDSLRKQMVEEHKAALQKEVSFGTMTQEEADQIISRMNNRMANGGGGYCGGNGGNHGGHHGWGNGGCRQGE